MKTAFRHVRGNSLRTIAGVAAEVAERDAALLEAQLTAKHHMKCELAQATLRILGGGRCNHELKQRMNKTATGRAMRPMGNTGSPVDEGIRILNTTIVGTVLLHGNILSPEMQKLPTWNRKAVSVPEWPSFGAAGERTEEQQEQALAHATQTMKKATETSDIVIITDGSAIKGAVGWAFEIHASDGQTLQLLKKESGAEQGTLGDSFMAETLAQLNAWRTINSNKRKWGIDANTTITMMTDSQSTIQSMMSTNPNYAATAELQMELAEVPANVVHAWIPAHCEFKAHDDVDEAAGEAAKESELTTPAVMRRWNRTKDMAMGIDLKLELQVAKRMLLEAMMQQQKKDWKTMRTKMGEIMQLKKKENPPPRKTFEHPNARIASRVNRMRTQRTMFQHRRWRKHFCRHECVPILQFQCDKCKKGNGGRWTYEWKTCKCKDHNCNGR